MPTPKKEKAPKKETSPSFEQSLEELEQMVETMETGDLPLEKLISSYERGAELISHCESVLNNARKRLELITLKAPSGDSKANSPNNLNQEENQEDGSSPNHSNDDDIRLF